MENNESVNLNSNQSVKVILPKSNTPMIAGLIGFIIGLPAVLCASACAAICSGVSSEMSKGAAAHGGASSGIGGMSMIPILFIICWIVGFIACFFGKSNISKKTGLATLLCGVFMLLCMVLMLNLMGMIPGVLYIVAGGAAMGNANKA